MWITPDSRANIDVMDERVWDDADAVAVLDEDEVDSAVMGGMESYTCAFCGEANDLLVDRTVSKNQQFTEDCDVCCRPNLVTVQIDPDGVVWINAEQEDEA